MNIVDTFKALALLFPLVFTTGLFAPRAACGQDYLADEGVITLGGNVSLTSRGGDYYASGDANRRTTITINPSAGYFITPGLSVGTDLLLSHQTQDDYSSTRVGIGPTASYYFGGESEEGLYPFVSFTPMFSHIGSDTGRDVNGFGATSSVGIAYQVARNIALTAEGYYQYLSYSYDNLDESAGGNTVGLRIGISGFIY